MTSDQLLVNLKDRAAIPPAQVAVTDTKLLNAASEELIAFICPLLDEVNEEYFTVSQDVALVANQAGYDMPARAAGGALRVLKFVDSNGIEAPRPVPRIELPDIGRYTSLSGNVPLGFYFTATQVVIVPTPSVASGSLRMYYSRRPGTLVTGAGTAVCTVATGSTDTVIAATTVNVTNFAVGQTIDIVSALPPFKTRAMDLAITASGVASITIGAGGLTAAGLTVGDYVTLATTSYVPQIPLEWHSLLELRTVARVFAVMGDMDGRQEAIGAAKDMQARLMAQAAPRSGGNSKKISAWR